ncbi:hypothetical protein QYF36_023389 [Acer negundo]|nr:hypothetical protein QYF36_023389 [Acer negundo]
MVTLTWVVSPLLNNRQVLKKVQNELNVYVGKHRQMEESDMKNLVDLQVIIKETLRLYPIAPLSGPWVAMEDYTIAGFHNFAGTCLVMNLWKLHHDLIVWVNPLEFIPERLIIDHPKLDARDLLFECLPFGSSIRKCLGISLTLRVLHLTLAMLLHLFELGTVSNTTVDMSKGHGLTVPKATLLDWRLSLLQGCLPCYLIPTTKKNN